MLLAISPELLTPEFAAKAKSAECRWFVRPDEVLAVVSAVVEKAARPYASASDPALRRYLATVIYSACRQMEHFVEPRVSQKAQAKADELGIGDLRHKRWKDLGGAKRAIFHLDHIVPVASMRDRILADPSQLNIDSVLRSASVAWLLKDEDRNLTRLGFRSDRDDPSAAYDAAGIVLMDQGCAGDSG